METVRDKKMTKRKLTAVCLPLLLIVMTFLGGCAGEAANSGGDVSSKSPSGQTSAQGESVLTLGGSPEEAVISEKNIPEYTGHPFVAINDNMPAFSESDFTENSFEIYSELDSLGRCGAAFANIGRDLMPAEKRGSIGQVKPSGWQTVKYDNVDGKYLYNRCHLIGFQLTAENANRRNLITGTRYFNVEGMLPFENMAADYVKETGGHVLYRVTPVFEGDNLVAAGVQMEACSVEDRGESVCFNVFVFNVQPGIAINYADGTSSLASNGGTPVSEPKAPDSSDGPSDMVIRGNSRSKIYHCPGQRAYEEMADSKNLVIFHSEKEAQDAGYRKAKNR